MSECSCGAKIDPELVGNPHDAGHADGCEVGTRRSRTGMMQDITKDMRERVADEQGNFIADKPQTVPRDHVAQGHQHRPVMLAPGSHNLTINGGGATVSGLQFGLPASTLPRTPTDLRSWWLRTASDDVDSFEPKFREYGAHDLVVIGKGLNPDLDDQAATEAGIAFYLLGKAARLVEAYRHGRVPSDDTWNDSAVYSFMGRRARTNGGKLG